MAGLIVAAVVSCLWCFAATWIGPRTGYVDRPDGSELKVHDTPAVPLGGVGVFIGLHLAGLINGDFDLVLMWATAIVLALGLIDDRWGLPPLVRLVIEVGAALVLVSGVAPGASPLMVGFSVFLVVFAINAVNLFDGLDGLASSVGLVAALGIAILATIRGLDGFMVPLALAAGLAGFLVLGWHPARVFLGDAGAYVIGMVLAATILEVSPAGGSELLLACGLLAIVATDLIVAVLRRVRIAHPLFEGDRSHVYDQLRDRGLAVTRVVFVAVLAQVIVAAIVVGVEVVLPGVAGVGVFAGLWLSLMAILARRGFLGTGADQ